VQEQRPTRLWYRDDRGVQHLDLPIVGELRIGRVEQNDLVLRDPELSRTHLVLTSGPGGVSLLVEGRNGCSLNGDLLDHGTERPVLTNDVIELGTYELRFEGPSGIPATTVLPPVDAGLEPAPVVLASPEPPAPASELSPSLEVAAEALAVAEGAAQRVERLESARVPTASGRVLTARRAAGVSAGQLAVILFLQTGLLIGVVLWTRPRAAQPPNAARPGPVTTPAARATRVTPQPSPSSAPQVSPVGDEVPAQLLEALDRARRAFERGDHAEAGLIRAEVLRDLGPSPWGLTFERRWEELLAYVDRHQAKHRPNPESSERPRATPTPEPSPTPAGPSPARDLDDLLVLEDEALAFRARLEELRRLAAGATGAKGWAQRALFAQEVGALPGRRPVAALVLPLADEDWRVRGFALQALVGRAPLDLRAGGGAELFTALLRCLRDSRPRIQNLAVRVLERLSAATFGKRVSLWKRWQEDHAAQLERSFEDPPAFEPNAAERKLLAEARPKRVRTGQRPGTRVRTPEGGGETRQPPQIPLLEGRSLDLMVCIDHTQSMESVIRAAQVELVLLNRILDDLVNDHRVGLITYDDKAHGILGLGRGQRRLREALARIETRGGGDVPEGVDKALAGALSANAGWRREAERVVVIVGDAPPRVSDQATAVQLARAKANEGFRVHAVMCRGRVPQLAEIARAGGGAAIELGADASTLLAQFFELVFGERYRDQLLSFTKTYRALIGL
jgi:Mg-chelatase subunit ChlD